MPQVGAACSLDIWYSDAQGACTATGAELCRVRMMDFGHGRSTQREVEEEAARPPTPPGDSDAPVHDARAAVGRAHGVTTGS